MKSSASMTEYVERFVVMKRNLGYQFRQQEWTLSGFARYAEDRDETFIRSETVLAWIRSCEASSPSQRIAKLHLLHAFAGWLHAENARHEVPPRDVLGHQRKQRPQPCLVSTPQIRKLLTAALSAGPAGTITPLTWHYLFGLIAATGLRCSEALALTLDDITADGLIIRETKFRKSRMVALHPTTCDALNRYLQVRCKEKTADRHLFIIATGGRPSRHCAKSAFRKLAEQTGLRKPGTARGPTIHSLRHSFAVRSIENLDLGADPGRHMLALATYLGHAKVSGTYWYLEATPILLRGIAEATEQSHRNGESCHD